MTDKTINPVAATWDQIHYLVDRLRDNARRLDEKDAEIERLRADLDMCRKQRDALAGSS